MNYSIDLSHYCKDGKIIDGSPWQAKKMANYCGSMVMWITKNMTSTISHDISNVMCNGKINKKPCLEYLIVGLVKNEIYWSCECCGSTGLISGWELTQWDRRCD